MTVKKLNERENIVLQLVTQQYVLTAKPVGSRTLEKMLEQQLSAATIRNTMADLEEMGLLTHVHASAGRQPTDMGYRYYVDNLSDYSTTRGEMESLLKSQIGERSSDPEQILQTTSKALGMISGQLGVALCPKFQEGIFQRAHLVPVSSNRMMVVVAISSGLVNTLTIEIKFEPARMDIEDAELIINKRLHGLTILEIQRTVAERLCTSDLENIHTIHLVRLFLDNAESLFNISETHQLYLSSTKPLLTQPEFESRSWLNAVIELLDEKDILIHFLRKREDKSGVYITIGGENQEGRFQSYSVVTSNYTMGNIKGTLGVIGPIRMPYEKMVPLVECTSNILNQTLDLGNS